MKNIFNKSPIFLIIFLTFFLIPFFVLAQLQGNDSNQTGGIQSDEPVELINPISPYNTIEDVIVRVTNYLLYIIGTVCVLILVFAGFTYVISAGNPEEIQKAKNRMTYAILGLFLAIIAWAIINSIMAIF